MDKCLLMNALYLDILLLLVIFSDKQA